MKRFLLNIVLSVSLAGTTAGQSVRIEVDASAVIRSVSPWLYGINTARWDESLFPEPTNEMLLTADRDAIRKIKESGVTVLKYPGGNDADSYIWNSPKNSASEMDTDEYIGLCREVGAEPFITVNFNQPAELAAEWVRYCNRERGYNVKLWEVGDEQWGTWAKGHAPPEEYAKKYVAFVKAMKAVDSSIKVATNVPLGPHPENWTTRVLRAAGDYVDMLTYTFFPQKWGHENDDSLLASVEEFQRLAADLRNEVKAVLGKERTEKLLFVNVGYNSVNHSPGPQTLQLVNAIWTADMIGTMAAVGTDIGCYWALHNAFPPRKGDYGYLSSEGSNTPSFSYYVFPLFTRYFGRDLVRATSSDRLMNAYASRGDHSLHLMIVNKNRTENRSLAITLKGFKPRASAEGWILDETRKNEPWNVSVSKGNLTLEVPPFSLVAIRVPDAEAKIPPVNIARSAVPSASSFSVIGPHFSPQNAVDVKMHTRWNSEAWTKSDGMEGQWFQLEWDQQQELTTVRIHWGQSRALDYVLEISPDGQRWRTIQEVKNGVGEMDEFNFRPIKTRFLRMNGGSGTKGISAYSIREIETFRLP
ncbi:MAG: discoidin domain-containing protein [Ignavibacteriales bacterium]|nr:discoidin domain-containing protein [Ignavibacteriales bacterium]